MADQLAAQRSTAAKQRHLATCLSELRNAADAVFVLVSELAEMYAIRQKAEYFLLGLAVGCMLTAGVVVGLSLYGPIAQERETGPGVYNACLPS